MNVRDPSVSMEIYYRYTNRNILYYDILSTISCGNLRFRPWLGCRLEFYTSNQNLSSI